MISDTILYNLVPRSRREELSGVLVIGCKKFVPKKRKHFFREKKFQASKPHLKKEAIEARSQREKKSPPIFKGAEEKKERKKERKLLFFLHKKTDNLGQVQRKKRR